MRLPNRIRSLKNSMISTASSRVIASVAVRPRVRRYTRPRGQTILARREATARSASNIFRQSNSIISVPASHFIQIAAEENA